MSEFVHELQEFLEDVSDIVLIFKFFPRFNIFSTIPSFPWSAHKRMCENPFPTLLSSYTSLSHPAPIYYADDETTTTSS